MAGTRTSSEKMEAQRVEEVEIAPVTTADTTADDDAGDVTPPGYWTSYRFIGSVIAIVFLGNNLFIGYSMPANILSIIGEDLTDLKPSPPYRRRDIHLPRFPLTLIKGVFLLLVGNISDIVGRRYFLLGGQFVNFVGAIIAARATSVNMLIGASALVGLGPHSLAVFPTIALGPAFARYMVANPKFGWRALYWLDAITVGVSFVLFAVCYFPPGFKELQGGRMSRKSILKRIDYVGFLLYGGGLVCLLLALSWGGSKYAWKSPTVIAMLVVGVVVLVVFALYEIYMTLEMPLLPMELFRMRSFVVAVIVGSCGQMSWYALNLLWPYHIENLYTTDNTTVGWLSCFTGIALALGEMIMGFFCRKCGRIRYQMLASVVLYTTFSGVMSIANRHRESLAIGMIATVGFCVGWIELLTIVVATLVVPPEQIGTGSAFFASTRATTGTIVTSIYVAIYNNRYASLMAPDVTRAVEAAGLPSSSVSQLLTAMANGTAAALNAVPGFNTTIDAAMVAGRKTAYATALGDVYLTSITFGSIAPISIFFAKDDIETQFTNFLNKTVTHVGNSKDELSAKEKGEL